ncbi:hypothetical protein VCRA2113O222_270064 [Vibrio crassostreae]|nr:hypothetical protein VCRA2113O222_270064 [Vibrio crassostreae]CAK1958735.1 hypothetical protein VCRA2113O197_270063 [Vibrio crassostreae]CAK1967298.1 hypothetical protein VCRA2113O196_290064 [Vibrio crassostreae]CAK3337625.1 hypothetical protein VCRA2123E279_270005 [Vibrio crassostreae]
MTASPSPHLLIQNPFNQLLTQNRVTKSKKEPLKRLFLMNYHPGRLINS